MRDSQKGFSYKLSFLRMPRTWLGWSSIGAAVASLVLFSGWLPVVDSTPFPGPPRIDPCYAMLLLGAVASERYRIIRKHAEGGLGAVYVALDQELQREVALKEILDRHAYDAASRERFVLEAEVTGGLEHPGIVPVYGLGEYQDGRPFYAMRFIRGESLKTAIADFYKAENPDRDPGERALAFRHMLTHFVAICEAIAYAHSRGVLHRDIKPENIMLGKFGETLVVDWGLAKPLGISFSHDGLAMTESREFPVIQTEILKFETGGAAGTTIDSNDTAATDGHEPWSGDPNTLGSSSETSDERPALPFSAGPSPETLDLRPDPLAALGELPKTFVIGEADAVTVSPSSETLEARPLLPKSLGRSSRTVVGSRMGTPAFMSPEQAAGHVDRLGPASDIYSLGGTLYNILTGKAPVTGNKPSNVLDQVIRGDFPAPRTLRPSIPPALEAIVLKAMALKPEDRYPTCKALSKDLEHWMADEPVSVYRDPWPSRVARWSRRHKTFVSGAAALLVTAVFGLTAGSILLERERARTDRERILAVKNYGYAYDAAETMLSRVGDVDLADIPQMEPVRRELLETARLRFDNLLEQQSGDREIILLSARTRARLGGVLEMMGQYGEAERNDRKAIELLDDLESRSPADDRPRREMARAHHGLGVLLRRLNRFREAESELREAVRLREELAAKFLSDRVATRALSDSRYQLGALLARLASRPEHKVLYNQAIKDQEAELRIDPAQPENRIKLAQYRNNLAILEASTNPALAEQEYRKILELLTSTGLSHAQAALPGVRWQSARASNNLAKILLTDAPPREEASEGQLTRARDDLARLVAEFPQIRQYRRELASVFNNLGRLALNRHKPEDAEASFRQSATLLKGLVASDPQVPDYQQNLSIALFQLESLPAKANLAGAREGMDRILADQEKLIVGHPEVPDYRNALGRNLVVYGRLLLDRDDASGASPLVEKAVARLREAIDGDPGNRTYSQNLYDAMVLKLLIALAMKQPEAAALNAESLIEVLPNHREAYLTAAEGLAECMVLVGGDEKLPPVDRGERSEAYGRRAVELLLEAVARRLLNGPERLRVEGLVPLRNRPDFRSLIKQLIERQQPLAL